MTDLESDWSADSNEATHISLATPGHVLHTFNPKFTYPIFGEEERIFGYQGLKINLKYHASDMRPVLQVTYNKKFKAVGDTEPTDLKKILEDFLPKTAFEKTTDFEAAIESTSPDWEPPGELWKTIQSGAKTFEVWKGSLADMPIQQMVKRIQILVPFFIEAGTLLELREPEWSLDRWTVFLLYQKTTENHAPKTSPYTFIGYSTCYRYFLYQPTTPPSSPPAKRQQVVPASSHDITFPLPEIKFSALPCRSRISQFIILPPYQGGGNGSRLYNAIFDYFLQDPKTIEITVEDPNESFDDLRDINDLSRLRLDPEFAALKINNKCSVRAKGPIPSDIVDTDLLEKIRTRYKIAPRQFYRVVEMQLLSLIPLGVRQTLIEVSKKSIPDLPAKEHEYQLWTLWVKKRLYKHNKMMLMQLDRPERLEKLDETTGSVEADFGRLLRVSDQRSKGSIVANGKRSSLDDDMAADGGEPSSKKVKFS
ncbi:acyl-CoA N-acyltransferase [Amylocarpus encephaloides]|uniref:Histone acetyltransferase type B catalytic subunit n=1 Tax=Amylocarpus encephaloides TaxID=45428 RepID=A0A9P8C9H7_9HELO|nr:acyl-CoA N-acyltransferase [Amylocarpus encephaloides]